MSNIAAIKCVRPTALCRKISMGKTASVVYAYGTLMQGKAAEDGSSPARMIATTSATERPCGVLDQAIAATDADYATNGVLKSLILDEAAEWEFTVGTGTADASDPQGYIDLKDSISVDVTASTIDLIFVTAFISATKVRGNITRWAINNAPATN